MLGDEMLSSTVILESLLASLDAADRVPLVHDLDGLVMLSFPVLDDERVIGVVGIDRKSHRAPLADVAEKPVEPMLSKALLRESLVAQVHDIGLITEGSVSLRSRARLSW